MEIRFTVTKNERCSGSFYDDYALQANFTLPGGVFSGISAPDATVAAVGADRQLTYTLLPGEGIDTVITAAADGFSLPAVSINGIYLNLNVDIDVSGHKRPGWPPRQCDRTAQQRRKRALHRQRSTARRRGRAAGRFDKPPERHSRARRRREELQDGLIVMRGGLDELYANSGALVSGAGQIYAGLAEIDAQLSVLDSLIDVGPSAADNQRYKEYRQRARECIRGCPVAPDT